MISTSVPCSIQLGHEAPWRPRELELEVSENGAGGVYPSRLVRGAGTRDLKYPLCEERPSRGLPWRLRGSPQPQMLLRRERLAWRHRPSEGRPRHPLSHSRMASLGTEGTL